MEDIIFYLSNIKLADFKSIQEVDIDLDSKINILIGPNGAGKSNFLQALYNATINSKRFSFRYKKRQTFRNFNYSITFRRTLSDDVNEIVISSVPVYSSSTEKASEKLSQKTSLLFKRDNIIIDEFQTESNNIEDIQKDLLTIDKKLSILQSPIGFIKYNFDYDLIFLSKPQSYNFNRRNETIESSDYSIGSMSFIDYIDTFIDLTLDENIKKILNQNYNDADILMNLQNSILKYSSEIIYEELKNDLKLYTPIKDIRFSKNINVIVNEDNFIITNFILEFNINDNWIPWDWLSDGTKRLFYLISEISSLKNGIIFIEEPELGVHPHQLHKLMDFIKSESTYTQFIISTHSPQVLNCIKDNELDSIILTKIDQNGSNFRHLSDTEIKKAKHYMKEVGYLSDYWVMESLEEIEDND